MLGNLWYVFVSSRLEMAFHRAFSMQMYGLVPAGAGMHSMRKLLPGPSREFSTVICDVVRNLSRNVLWAFEANHEQLSQRFANQLSYYLKTQSKIYMADTRC